MRIVVYEIKFPGGDSNTFNRVIAGSGNLKKNHIQLLTRDLTKQHGLEDPDYQLVFKNVIQIDDREVTNERKISRLHDWREDSGDAFYEGS